MSDPLVYLRLDEVGASAARMRRAAAWLGASAGLLAAAVTCAVAFHDPAFLVAIAVCSSSAAHWGRALRRAWRERPWRPQHA